MMWRRRVRMSVSLAGVAVLGGTVLGACGRSSVSAGATDAKVLLVGVFDGHRGQFDNHQDGFDTNTQILGDPPPPQNGDCPDGKISPITHTRSCWVFIHNDVHNNNDATAPEAAGGYARAGPVGTGMTVSGGRNDTVMDNSFADNGAWGVLFAPFPGKDKSYAGVTCHGSGEPR